MLCMLCRAALRCRYGNYVIQSALTVTTAQLHGQLVDHIRPHLPALRGTPHGKRILAKVSSCLLGLGEGGREGGKVCYGRQEGGYFVAEGSSW